MENEIARWLRTGSANLGVRPVIGKEEYDGGDTRTRWRAQRGSMTPSIGDPGRGPYRGIGPITASGAWGGGLAAAGAGEHGGGPGWRRQGKAAAGLLVLSRGCIVRGQQ